MLITPPQGPSYEILSSYMLGGVLIKLEGKIGIIARNMIADDGTINKTGLRKLRRMKHTERTLAEYKNSFNESAMREITARTNSWLRHQRLELKKNQTYQINVTCDGKSGQNRICVYADDWKAPLYFGESPAPRPVKQSTVEFLAAHTAVELTKTLRKKCLRPGVIIHMILKTDLQGLCNGDSAKSPHMQLLKRAAAANINLEIEFIPGKENPADVFTTGRYQHEYNALEEYSAVQLKTLFTPLAKILSHEPSAPTPIPQRTQSKNANPGGVSSRSVEMNPGELLR